MQYATREGTLRYAQRSKDFGLSGTAFRDTGRADLVCSVLGFGGYRVGLEAPDHREALMLALRSGCNLIDTSTNYTDGESESLVGEAIASVTAHDFRRDEFIVVSKVGYVQGQNLALAMQRESKGTPFPEMVKYMDGCWHCLHPEFIADQLDRSLERLRVGRIDTYLLHNPEYFLSDAKKRKLTTPLSELRNEFYRRLAAAFQHLEIEVGRGRISHYGVSSNTFGGSVDDVETTSLTRMWELAEKLGNGGSHHFSMVQLPLNLFEAGPVLEKNNGPAFDMSVLEFAASKRIAVLVNRPLNAFFNHQLLRLADFPTNQFQTTLPEQLLVVKRLETEFNDAIAPSIPTEKDSVPATSFFRWSEELENPQLTTLPLEHWSQIESGTVRPQVGYLMDQLDQYFEAVPLSPWKGWRPRYLQELETLLRIFRDHCSKLSQETSRKVSSKLDPFLPEEYRAQSLSRKALATLIHTSGVTCVLNGMRTPDYVKNSLGSAKGKAFTVSPKLYQAFRLGG